MICESAIAGNSSIAPSASVQPCSNILQSTIGEGCVIEDKCTIEGSTLERDCLVSVGSILKNCVCGHTNEILQRTRLVNCKIGNFCFIGAGVSLDGADVPSNSSVFVVDGELRVSINDRGAMQPILALYRTALSDGVSPQALSKNHQLRSA